MTDMSTRVAWGVVGVIVGFLIGGVGSRLQGSFMPAGMSDFGMPMFFLVLPLLFGTFWILLIAGAIKWLFMNRDRNRERMADLPADFDDWHRRAHAQMDREAAARAAGTQP